MVGLPVLHVARLESISSNPRIPAIGLAGYSIVTRVVRGDTGTRSSKPSTDLKLKGVFGLNDINDLPVSYDIAC